ncbi:MAG: hypothetical protein Ct9H300mP19_16900 [Dehalococcoidia bacterium]|nr:MAG: hypothetical protein Ct9H300mP19_16900 [Dehalococcoidia bacterium]
MWGADEPALNTTSSALTWMEVQLFGTPPNSTLAIKQKARGVAIW